MCPYRIGERVRALKLLRSVRESMLLMWDSRITFLSNGQLRIGSRMPILQSSRQR